MTKEEMELKIQNLEASNSELERNYDEDVNALNLGIAKLQEENDSLTSEKKTLEDFLNLYEKYARALEDIIRLRDLL